MTDKERLEEIVEYEHTVPSGKHYVRFKRENDYEWLVKQVERVEELEKVIGDLDENVAAFETLWLEEKRKNQCYKQALEFYADEENYKEKLISEAQYDADGICISNDDYAPPIIYFDSGEKARQALKGEMK